jgi:hypothetical protein
MGSGKGKARRAQSSQGSYGDDTYDRNERKRVGRPVESEETVFYDLELWCSKQPDPEEKRRIFGIFSLIEFYHQSRSGKEVMTGAAESLKGILSQEGDKRTTVASIIAIAQLRVKNALPELEAVLEETEEPHIKEAIALAYGYMRIGETRQQLEQLQTDSNSIVRQAATWALSVLPSPEEAEAILLDEFVGFMNEVTASDFERYAHYHNED